MVRTLLIRGMLIGILAGLLVFGFSKMFGEPSVDRAIAFETAMDEAKAAAHPGMAEPEPELVSRGVQASYGLLTGVVVYCAAFGGLFALVFAFVHGRVGTLGARATSALLAGGGFVAVYVVPSLKYPANPPSVGEPETIGQRTALFFAMMVISIAAMVGAVMIRRRLAPGLGAWSSSLAAAGCYVAIIVLADIGLPTINEVPDGFPATVLWDFRMASLGMQAIMWATIGLLFGWLTERGFAVRRPRIVARQH
jgi:predicted cobalt transporter CbtA